MMLSELLQGMQPLPLPSNNTVNYQLSRQQIVWPWVRRRILRPSSIIANAFIIVVGICLGTPGQVNYLGWFFAATPLLVTFFYYRIINRTIDQNPEITEPRSMTFDSEGVVFVTASTRSELMWNRIKRLTENKDFYFLHLDTHTLGRAVTIPKSAFNPEQRENFLSSTRAIAS
jgi:hypothetical protein